MKIDDMAYHQNETFFHSVSPSLTHRLSVWPFSRSIGLLKWMPMRAERDVGREQREETERHERHSYGTIAETMLGNDSQWLSQYLLKV